MSADSRAKGTSAIPGNFNDEQMEAIMGRLLQVGVLAAAAVVLVGGTMYLAAHAQGHAEYGTFRPRPVTLLHPGALIRGIKTGDSKALIDLGILMLIATPICRVVFAVVAFAIERDRLYVAVSLTVLAVLLSSLLRGH